MMTWDKNVANVVGGKTARACDSCITKRARWYCAADDAFLCQSCDSSVHSANPLARRHERVRLKTSSYKSSEAAELSKCITAPSWHHGFRKKARTPRQGKNNNHSTKPPCRSNKNNPFHMVPAEEGSDEVMNYSHDDDDEEDNEAQLLLYRVPIFDPSFVAELCSPPSSVPSPEQAAAVITADDAVVGNKGSESKVCLGNHNNNSNNNNDDDDDGGGGVDERLHRGFLASDEIELAQFAADVESLLGRELENECIGIEELGLVDEQESWECCVKVEHEEEEEESTEVVNKLEEDDDEMGREAPFELSFDYDCDESREETRDDEQEEEEEEEVKESNRKRKILQLDYEAVISAWATTQKSPWTTGLKPNLDYDHCWPHCMGSCGAQVHYNPCGEMYGYGFHPVIMGDGGREARVSRYREKRRTRLFSKKIRYEVRKLNAEKRPRMKGRFVKRASFAATPTSTFSVAK